MSATKPTPVVVVKEKETPPTTDIMGEVVTTLPKALQEKGRQLVSRFKDNTVERQRRVVARRGGRTRQ